MLPRGPAAPARVPPPGRGAALCQARPLQAHLRAVPHPAQRAQPARRAAQRPRVQPARAARHGGRALRQGDLPPHRRRVRRLQAAPRVRQLAPCPPARQAAGVTTSRLVAPEQVAAVLPGCGMHCRRWPAHAAAAPHSTARTPPRCGAVAAHDDKPTNGTQHRDAPASSIPSAACHSAMPADPPRPAASQQLSSPLAATRRRNVTSHTQRCEAR